MGPGQRLTSCGRGGDGRSTDGGGGQKHCPHRTGSQYWGRWKSASAAGLPGALAGFLRKKRQSKEEKRRVESRGFEKQTGKGMGFLWGHSGQ